MALSDLPVPKKGALTQFTHLKKRECLQVGTLKKKSENQK
jgi:hypothetical protein